MSLNDDIALLSIVPLFSEIGEDKLRLIAFGAEHRRVSAGQQLFRQGAAADCGFAVVSGRFSLVQAGRNGQPVSTEPAERGTLLSELALISMVDRKFTATADIDSDVIRINRPLFRRMLEEYPEVAAIVQARLRDSLGTLVRRAGAMQNRFA